MNSLRPKLAQGLLLPFCAFLLATGVQAQSVEQVLQADAEITDAARAGQQEINQIADETQRVIDEYRTVAKQVEGLKVYNAQLALQIEDQERDIASLDRSIDEASRFEAQLAPVMEEMIESLRQFVELDLPFRLDERRESVERLQTNLGRSDITSAEKFRQILEVYSIEQDYGLNLETYESTIQLNGVETDVNIFRMGRIAMVYQTLDQAQTGAWNKQTGSWETLSPGDYQRAVVDAIKIAKKQAAIDIISLPVSAPQG